MSYDVTVKDDDPEEASMYPTAKAPVSNEHCTWSSLVKGSSMTTKPPAVPAAGHPSVTSSRSESKEGTPLSQYGGSAGKPYRGNRGTSQVFDHIHYIGIYLKVATSMFQNVKKKFMIFLMAEQCAFFLPSRHPQTETQQTPCKKC